MCRIIKTQLLFFSDFRTAKDEYQENLEVRVIVTLKNSNKTSNLFGSKINSKKKFNSWFYVDFQKKVSVPEGAKCLIDVYTRNSYQLIPFAHIQDNLEQAKKCAAFSKFDIFLYELEKEEDKKYTQKSFQKEVDYFFCIKSLVIDNLGGK